MKSPNIKRTNENTLEKLRQLAAGTTKREIEAKLRWFGINTPAGNLATQYITVYEKTTDNSYANFPLAIPDFHA